MWPSFLDFRDTEIPWREAGNKRWAATLPLPEKFLKDGGTCLPSFSMRDHTYTWQAALMNGSDILAQTLPIGQDMTAFERAFDTPEQGLSQKLDYFQIKGGRTGPLSLKVSVQTEKEESITDSLLTMSLSHQDIEEFFPDHEVVATPLNVPSLSQMEEEEHIKSRICSPTSLAMVLSCYKVPFAFPELLQACYHEQADIYGVWPQNIWAASRFGAIGTVRYFVKWHKVASLLQKGIPVIASIRYEEGDLTDAPMQQTQGHLVVICGLEKDYVHVSDPAAKTQREVRRSYDKEEFANAWRQHGGVGYVLYPPSKKL